MAHAWPTVSAYVRQFLADCRTRFLSLQNHWSAMQKMRDKAQNERKCGIPAFFAGRWQLCCRTEEMLLILYNHCYLFFYVVQGVSFMLNLTCGVLWAFKVWPNRPDTKTVKTGIVFFPSYQKQTLHALFSSPSCECNPINDLFKKRISFGGIFTMREVMGIICFAYVIIYR